MGTILNLVTNITGVWKKIAILLPLIAGASSTLIGAGGILAEISKASNADGILKIIQGLSNDPNTALIIAGLTALGIHTNHSTNAAAIDLSQKT